MTNPPPNDHHDTGGIDPPDDHATYTTILLGAVMGRLPADAEGAFNTLTYRLGKRPADICHDVAMLIADASRARITDAMAPTPN